ncbi:hypothetical protein NBRC10512_004785 [Rhodotorula toruloides]|uniref:RHTO0S03e04698g1_1 n=2 Tax=Rhodotorula toruloides TaxID=5286 RepID=A0A061AKQ2_RHOTO|nr:ribosomal protein L9 family protein [Rhodotorula toruloides NP11]EMS25814.1 ribosomal protein L9 family protein [Rhodotorula toruloides NP11]CDR38155.1 RHTO0S03e04698g1_1 [Rhodotorula toruloides]
MLLGTSAQILSTARVAARPACAACRVQGQQRSAHKLVQVKLLEDLPGRGTKGSVVIVSPGYARNILIPNRKALYVNRNGEAVSPLRTILRLNAEKLLQLNHDLRAEEEQRKEREAKAALEQMSRDATSARRLDEQAALHQADKTRLAELARAPPILFTRLTISPTSSDLFGSVSTADVVAELRELGFQDFSHMRTAFREHEGIVNGRIKATGTFEFVVSSRTFDEEAVVKVKVTKGEGNLGMKTAAEVKEEPKVVEAEAKAAEKP